MLSVAMLLRHSLDLTAEAQAVEQAVADAISDGVRTADIAPRGGPPRPARPATRSAGLASVMG